MSQRLRMVLSLILPGLVLVGCAARHPERDPTGERFPSVRGTGLDDTPWQLPDDFAGRPVLLLVGYAQFTQFDLDRWLLAIADTGLEVEVYELPTIPGLLPGLWAGQIDAGMRRGIPREDWAVVITVYGDAGAITRFTGNTDRLPGRVLLLDDQGVVRFFHDRGYSAGAFTRMRDALVAVRRRPRQEHGAGRSK